MADVDEIKKRVDIVQLVGEYLTLKKSGITYKGLCPFHSEKTPSFTVSAERQSWHCFGCSEGGDIFSFVQKIEGLDFKEALEKLANRAGVEITPVTEAQKQQKSDRFQILEVLENATNLFQQILKMETAKEAREYLQKRGLDEETIAKFRIGYAPDAWHTTEAMLRKKNFDSLLGVKSGLAIQREGKSGFYDRFRDRIVFPIDDPSGKIVGFTGRIMSDAIDQAKYLNTSETPVFHKSEVLYAISQARTAIKSADLAVMMEGQMDVIAAHQFGFTNTVATSGTAITEDHLKLLNRYTQNLAFAFDNDAAGIKAAQNAVVMCFAAEMNPFIVRIPYGKDPDECIRHDIKMWQAAVEHKIPAVEFLIDYYIARLGGQLNALNKKNVVHQSLAIINKVKDPIEQLEYAKLLSSKVGVPESIIVSELQHQESNSIAGGEELAEQKTVFSPYFELEKQLIGLLLTYFDNLPELPKMILENEALNEIYQVICEARVQKSDIEVALKKTPDAWQKRMDALVIETIQRHEGEDEEATRLDIVDTITRLQDRDRDNRVASNAQAIAAAFAAGDKEKARKLLKKLDSDTIDKV